MSGSKGTLKSNGSWSDALHNLRFRLLNRWSNQPGVDIVLAGFAVGVHALLVFQVGIGDVLGWADQTQRLAIYAAGAGMMSLIAGFTGNAIAQYGSSTGPLFSSLRARHGQLVRRTWVGIAAWLLLGTVACIVAMAVDGGLAPRGSQWIFEIALAIACAKFARLAFLFDLMLSTIDSQVERRPNVLSRRRPPAFVSSQSD